MKKLMFLFLMLTAFFVNAAQYPLSLGGGGLPKWETAVNYKVDEIVWEPVSLKFYKAIDAHLSGATFPPDLAFPHWEEMADNLNRELDGTVNDDRIVRWDGTDGDNVQDSLVSINDAGEVAGATKLNVDNIEVNANTITVTDLNGDLHLSGNGTGKTVIDGDLQVDGTTTTVNSTVMDVAAAKITVNVGGNQASADSGSALEIEMSDATDAKLKYDSTTTSKFSVGEIGSEKEIVTVSDVQAITNKDYGNSASIDANLVLDIVTTSKASRPCPQMTEAQRDLLTAVNGSCIYNTDQKKLNVYDGATWVSAGGGLDQWVTAFDYKIDDTVHENNKIYKALTNHTSGTFSTDLGNNDWVELSDDLNREAALSVVDNAVTRWDGTGGDDVQNSLVIIDDLGNMTGLNSINLSGGILTDILDMGQVVTPANPAASRDKLYFKNDDKLYSLTALGVEKEVGATLSFINDNRLLRSDTVGPDGVQESGITVTDGDQITGANVISGANFDLGTSLQFPGAVQVRTQILGAPYNGFWKLTHENNLSAFGANGADLYGYGDNEANPALAGKMFLMTNGKDILFDTDAGFDNPLAKIDGATGTFLQETPTDTEYKPVGEVYKGEENYFLRGQCDYGLPADWVGANLTRDTTSTNFINGEFCVWKWTDIATIGNQLVSQIIDIPRGMRASDIGYQFRYKYDGDDSDLDVLVQCVDNSAYLVGDGEHKLAVYTAVNGSAFATGEFNPAGCSQVKVIFKVAIAYPGKILFFDSVKVTPFNPTIKKLTDRQFSSSPYGVPLLSGTSSSLRFNTITSDNNSIIAITDNGTNTVFTAKRECTINLTVSAVLGINASNSFYFNLNGAADQISGTPSSLDYEQASYNKKLKIGDYVTVTTIVALRLTAGDFKLTATADTDKIVRMTDPNAVDSMIRFNTANGHGSSSNKIRRYSQYTTDNNVAFQSAAGQTITTNAIRCIDSATLALECEILETGTYTIGLNDYYTAGVYEIGISASSNQLTTSISGINDLHRLEMTDGTANNRTHVSWSGTLSKGQIIRPHDNGALNNTNITTTFTISKAKVSPHVSIPVDDEFQNEFSAKGDAAGVIVSSNSDWINGNCVEAPAGVFTCQFKAGLFTQAPACVPTTENTSVDTGALMGLVSNTSMEILTQFSGTLNGTIPWNIKCAAQGSDVKLKTGIVTGKFAATRTCIIEDRKGDGIQGGTSVGNIDNVRIHNTSSGDCEFLTLSNGTTGINGTANQFTLLKGKYYIDCTSPVSRSNSSQLHLRNITDGVTDIPGQVAYVDTALEASYTVNLKGVKTYSSPKTFELRQYVRQGRAGSGLGLAAYDTTNNPNNLGVTYNVYSQCKIQKVR